MGSGPSLDWNHRSSYAGGPRLSRRLGHPGEFWIDLFVVPCTGVLTWIECPRCSRWRCRCMGRRCRCSRGRHSRCRFLVRLVPGIMRPRWSEWGRHLRWYCSCSLGGLVVAVGLGDHGRPSQSALGGRRPACNRDRWIGRRQSRRRGPIRAIAGAEGVPGTRSKARGRDFRFRVVVDLEEGLAMCGSARGCRRKSRLNRREQAGSSWYRGAVRPSSRHSRRALPRDAPAPVWLVGPSGELFTEFCGLRRHILGLVVVVPREVGPEVPLPNLRVPEVGQGFLNPGSSLFSAHLLNNSAALGAVVVRGLVATKLVLNSKCLA